MKKKVKKVEIKTNSLLKNILLWAILLYCLNNEMNKSNF